MDGTREWWRRVHGVQPHLHQAGGGGGGQTEQEGHTQPQVINYQGCTKFPATLYSPPPSFLKSLFSFQNFRPLSFFLPWYSFQQPKYYRADYIFSFFHVIFFPTAWYSIPLHKLVFFKHQTSHHPIRNLYTLEINDSVNEVGSRWSFSSKTPFTPSVITFKHQS